MKLFKYFFTIAYFLLMANSISATENDAFECSIVDEGSVEQRLQTLLDECLVETGTSGAVMLVQSPSLLWIGASGTANIKLQTPMRSTDLLRIGSITKMFVGATFLKLSEEEKIDLDATIDNYLPNSVLMGIKNSDVITIRQLLNMTSGIYNYTESDDYTIDVEDRPNRSFWRPEELLEYAFEAKASFAPGTGWEYSNTNYILLDMIVAKVSGTSLAAEMRRLIHKPLGLKNTFMEKQEPRSGGFGGLKVRGYDDGEDITEINDALGFGDGGLISDAEGLAAFLTAVFLDKNLLSNSSLAQMLDFIPNANYGLGVSESETDFGIAWGHNGSTAGFLGDMIYLPEEKTIFILLTNDFNSELMPSLFVPSMKILLD